jgi:hypothetical protein
MKMDEKRNAISFSGKDERRKPDQPPSKKSALDEIREIEERKKEIKNRKEFWLHENIVVKVRLICCWGSSVRALRSFF